MNKPVIKLASALMLTVALLGTSACAQLGDEDKGPTKIENEKDSLSYVFGLSLGINLEKDSLTDINMDILKQGVEDGLKGEEAHVISMEDGMQVVRTYMTKKADKQAEAGTARAAEFLKENASKEGVQTTESGLQYKVITQGDGPKPTLQDKVKVHYQGTLIEGGEPFDSSYKNGQPVEFNLTQVIPGWTEILQLMPVGSKYEAYISPELAYGRRGSPPVIGPNEALIFEIELLDIVTDKSGSGDAK